MPLAWLLAVTCTASWQKVLSPDPRLGFLALAERTEQQVAAGEMAAGARPAGGVQRAPRCAARHAVRGRDLLVVVVSSAREWLLVLRGRKPACSRETPFVETAYAD